MEVVSNPSLLREESYLRKKGLEGLVDILENMLRYGFFFRCHLLVCATFFFQKQLQLPTVVAFVMYW